MCIHLKCILLSALVIASVGNAQQFGGVVKFQGAIVQAPCKVNVVSDGVLSSSCIFNNNIVTQNISLNTINNTKRLSMYKLRTQKLKGNKNGIVLHMNYM